MVAITPVFQGLRCCKHICTPRTTLLQAHLCSKDYAAAGKPSCIPRTTLLQAHLYSKDYAVAGTHVFQGLGYGKHTCTPRAAHLSAPPGYPPLHPASLPYKCLVCTIHISNVSFTNNSVLCSQSKQCCNNSRTCLEL